MEESKLVFPHLQRSIADFLNDEESQKISDMIITKDMFKDKFIISKGKKVHIKVNLTE